VDLTFDQDEEAILRAARRLFDEASNWETVRAAEPLGFDGGLWGLANETGLSEISIEETFGGGGGSLLHAAVVLEEAGRHAAPVPLAEHLVASRLLARTQVLSDDALRSVVSGDAMATISLQPALGGTWHCVPAGAIALYVCGIDGHDLVISKSAAPQRSLSNHACAPIAHRLANGVRVDDVGRLQEAFDEWKVLTAAQLVGIASASLQIGVEYAKERTQFGRPIGWFQAVQHPLAELVGPIDGTRLLVAKAAWSCEYGHADRSTLAAMAFFAAGMVAKRASAVSLHCQGGYGVMEENAIQLLFRRARGWSLIAGDPAMQLLKVSDCLFGPSEAIELQEIRLGSALTVSQGGGE
jgi:alkylation response protein AidB-like acyl-CoA dehydrogenase